MLDLICANCQTFNQASCPPRCSVRLYAQSDSPACQFFIRTQPVYLDLQTGNQFLFTRSQNHAQA